MWYKIFLQKILLPFGDLVFRSKYSFYLKQVEQTLSLRREEIVEIRNNKLLNILNHARENSEYYSGLNISQLENPICWLKEFPILTKEIVREKRRDLLTKEKGLIKNCTSGSTGVQTEIYLDKNEQSLIRAIQTNWWIWAGFEIGKPIYQTGLSSSRSIEKKLKDFFFLTYYQFAFGLTEKNTKRSLEWAKNNKPFLGGYASSLYVLSKLAEKRNVKMRSAVSWGDKLFDHYRKNIELVFDCRVYETYGTGEGLMLGAQKDLDYLYIMEPYFIVELLNEKGEEVADGEIGQVIVTSLIHKTMPLIRYKVGDLAIKLPKNKYPSKRDFELAIFQKIIGRETDIVKTKNGVSLIVHSFTGVFEYFPEIKQFQVIQKRGETSLLIKYISDSDFNREVLNVIREKLNSLASENLELTFVKVEFIPDSNSGKPQIIIIED